MELRVGGKYRIGKKLGEGAFGLTCSGVNIKSNEEVAIKLVSTSLIDVNFWSVDLNISELMDS